MSGMTNILIDCDPGLDDAVALLAALGAPSLNVIALTTVAGNVKGPQTAYNARVIRRVAGRGGNVPVFAGAPGPMLRDQVTAEDFHGTTGLGDIAFPDPRAELSDTHAVIAIVEQCRAAKLEPLTVVCTGPLTNLALALRLSPDIKHGIAEIVLMGGADCEGGNITPHAEFNIYADPHAAAIVFGCGLSIKCLSLDVTHTIRSAPERIAQVRAVGTPQAEAAAKCLEASCNLEFSAAGVRDAPLHDPSTIIALLRPELFRGQAAFVTVDTDMSPDNHTFGQTRVRYAEDGNVTWYQRADVDGVYDALCAALGGYA